MGDIVVTLLEFPPADISSRSPKGYDTQVRTYLSNIRQINPQHFAHIPGQDLIELLDAAVNSIAYLTVLSARLKSYSGKSSISDFVVPINCHEWNRIVFFLNNFDAIQIRYIGHDWRNLLECLYTSAIAQDNPAAAISPIKTAMLRLDRTTSTFTSTHVLLLRLCLMTRDFQSALPILDNTIFNFPMMKSSDVDEPYPCADHRDSAGYITIESGLTAVINVATVHEYYILGSLVYIALHKWEEAQLFLELILVSPTQSVANGFMLEAYRKWVLVSCIIHGRVPEPLKNVNATALRTIRTASKAYDNLVEVFQMGDRSRLDAEIDVGMQEWVQDGNYGLVLQLKKQVPWFLLQDMQKTYSALPISTVANWLNSTQDETVGYIMELVEKRLLNAEVEFPEDKEPILRFYPNLSCGPLAKTEEEHYEEVLEQVKRTNAIAEQVKSADARLSVSKHWVDHLKKKNTRKGEEGNMGQEEMDQMPWGGDGDADEDLMEMS